MDMRISPALQAPMNASAARPLFVDLDGTLVRTDLLYESFLDRLRHDWLLPGRALAWLAGGKARLKARLAADYEVPSASLPYNEAVLDHVREARAEGRPVYLATASHARIADGIAGHLGLFDGVIASDADHNLSGRHKLARLRAMTGSDDFEYLGNSEADIPIWDACTRAGVVEPDGPARRWLAANEGKASTLEETGIDPAARRGLGAYLRVLRPHQWLKNLLLLVPLVAAHRLFDLPSVLAIVLAFIAFSLCASAVYVINDMLDLNADRAHPRKRLRPFASGAVPLSFGFQAAPVLLLGAFAVGAAVSPAFLVVLGLYLAMTFAYSLSLKGKLAIDVLMLATLYTMRIVAGTAAIQVTPSHWLLGFSIFLFFGLALVKRSSELMVAAQAGKAGASGRSYRVDDLPMINTMGVASSYLSVLVLALYINGPDVARFYATPYGLWLLCPLLLYWLTRVWLITRRGEMHDDPVVYAAKDSVSRAVGLCGVLIILASTYPLPGGLLGR